MSDKANNQKNRFQKYLINGIVFSLSFAAAIYFALNFDNEKSGRIESPDRNIDEINNRLMDNISSGSGPNDSKGVRIPKEFDSLLDFLKEYEMSQQDLYVSLIEQIGASGVSEILIESIDEPGKLEKAKNKLLSVDKIFDEYRRKYLGISKKFAEKLSKVNIPGDENHLLESKLIESIKNGTGNLLEYFDLQKDILLFTKEIQEYMEKRSNKYTIIDGEVVFEKKEDQEKFQEFGIGLLNFKRKENEWLRKIEQQGGLTDESIIRVVEDYILSSLN